MIYGWSRTHSGSLSTLSVGRVMPDDKSRLVVPERVSHIVLNNSMNLEFTLKLNARHWGQKDRQRPVGPRNPRQPFHFWTLFQKYVFNQFQAVIRTSAESQPRDKISPGTAGLPEIPPAPLYQRGVGGISETSWQPKIPYQIWNSWTLILRTD